jgi:predicted AAA+ superfamily ATPase
MWIGRDLSSALLVAATQRPALLLSGARQTGKSSLLRHAFPGAAYVSFDRPAVSEEADSNPTRFLEQFKDQVILDEIQNAPTLFRELKARIDVRREHKGKWLLTGSQHFPLMKGVSESLAGRIRVFDLDSLSIDEVLKAKLGVSDYLWKGGYPELWSQPGLVAGEFFDDYVTTYLERDLRTLLDVGSLRTFDRFLRLCTLRCANLLNYSDLARDTGISPVTAKSWVQTLEVSGIVSLLEPFFSNQSKRLVKTPKLYFRDVGLLAFFLGVSSEASWRRSSLQGLLWENLVFGELLRGLKAKGKQRFLFFWRDKDSHEVDFLIEKEGAIVAVEAKSAERPALSDVHFRQLEKCFPRKRIIKCIACMHSGARPSTAADDVWLWNPLRHGFSAFWKTVYEGEE